MSSTASAASMLGTFFFWCGVVSFVPNILLFWLLRMYSPRMLLLTSSVTVVCFILAKLLGAPELDSL